MSRVTEYTSGCADWLLDSAEKLEDEGVSSNLATGRRAWGEAIQALLADRATLLEALTFYATAEAYEVDADRGNVASKALKMGDL